MTDLQRVLYVDDEPDIRTVASLALETVGGMTICTCASGEEALKKIGDFKPDIVLLDVMMPIMDGPDTLEQIRKLPEGKQYPVMFFTAKTRSEDIEQLRGLGAIGVLSKPFDPMTLADRVRDSWREHCETASQASAPETTLSADAAQAKFDALTSKFISTFKEDLTKLQAIHARFAINITPSETMDRLAEVGFIAHQLAGRGGTFGFPEISKLSSSLENIAIALRNGGGKVTDKHIDEMSELLTKLSEQSIAA